MHRRSLLSCAAALALGAALGLPASAQQAYTVTDLGVHGGSLNNVGQVCFTVKDSSGYSRPYLWTPSTPNGTTGTVKQLGLPSGVKEGWAIAVNDAGQVAGQMRSGSTNFIGRWDARGVPTITKMPGESKAINASGQITGTAYFNGTNSSPSAFLWSGGSIVQIVPSYSQGQYINRDGWVEIYNGSTPNLWKPTQPNGTSGSMTQLPFGSNGHAYGLNDSGQVLGMAYINGYQHAVIYSDATGAVTDLGIPAGYDSAWAPAFNNLGRVVGQVWNNATNDNGYWFLWDSTNGMRNLNDPALFAYYNPDGTPSSWLLDNFYALNDHGQMLLSAKDSTGQQHSLLLTPR